MKTPSISKYTEVFSSKLEIKTYFSILIAKIWLSSMKICLLD